MGYRCGLCIESSETERSFGSTGSDMSSNRKQESLAWEEVHTEHIVEDEWIDFRKTAWRFPDGRVIEPFYSYSRKNYVVVVATDPEGNYICVRQFRQGIRKVTTELPAGAIEHRDNRECEDNNVSESDALAAAKRELLEETGYESDEWTHLLTIPSNATMADNYAHLYMAKNCRKVASQSLDETEFLNVIRLSEQEIEEMVHNGCFEQVAHVTALLLAQKN